MPGEPETLALGADFPPATREQWRALVRAVLARSATLPAAPAGADAADAEVDVEAALSWTTYDDIVIRPLYTAADSAGVDANGLPGFPPFVRGADRHGAAGWDVRARHADPDPAATNAAALTDLGRGASSLWLVLGARGLPVSALDAALDGVHLDLVPMVLDAGPDTLAAARALRTLVERRGLAPQQLRGSLGADPIGARARAGAALDADLAPALAGLRTAFANMRSYTVDGTVYHEAGASDAQEIGIATAVGVAYLRGLTAAGLSVDEAVRAVDFRFAVTAEQFPSIAKLRAARQLWNRVAELSGAAPERRAQHQHAVTSAAVLTRRDPWVNMLRTSIGCFAAAVGGAQAITVLPFDSAIGRSDDFARRIARNTHAILHDEASLARVVDPAGGSWFVESLTAELGTAAWAVFTDIEKRGGAAAALDDGTLAGLLAGTKARRGADIAHRRSAIIGVSEFAHLDEQPVDREPLPPEPPAPAPALPRVRYAQPFEALRDRSDAAAAGAGRPRVFLATLGPAGSGSARAGFAANLFHCAGIECLAGAVSDFAAAGTTVACLCSSDEGYAAGAATAAVALRAAGATHIWLAGRVGSDGVDGYGVDGYLYAGCDALDAVRVTLDQLGVPR